MTSSGAQKKNKKWQAKNNEMLQEYLFRYNLPRPLAPQWVDWFRISLSHWHSRGQLDKRYGQQDWSPFPHSTNALGGGGGGCQPKGGVGGGGGSRVKKISRIMTINPYPTMPYMSWVYTKLIWMDAMNKRRKSISGDTLTTAKNLVFFFFYFFS